MTFGKYARIGFSFVIGGLLLAALLLPLTGVAHADTGDLFVAPNGSGDCAQSTPCNLQTALIQATDGNTLYLAQGTYTNTGNAVITITHSITLYGGWNGNSAGQITRNPDTYPTIINGEGARRGIRAFGDFTTTIDGVRITNGYVNGDNGAAIKVVAAKLTLKNCQVYSNTANNGGASMGGIAIFADGARIENNRIFNNTGSGIGLSPGRYSIVRENFIYNNFAGSGAGIQIQNGNAITLTANSIFSNTASSSGGAIWLQNGQNLLLNNNSIYSNTAQNIAGIRAYSVYTLSVEGNLFHHNHSNNGGALTLYQGENSLVRNNIFAENSAQDSGSGSGIDIYAATAQIVHNTLARNHGRGIYVSGNAAVWLTNTIIASNTIGIEVALGSAQMDGTLWGQGNWANQSDWVNDDTLITGAVNIWGNPAFVNPDGLDYHIGAESAAVDAGVDSATPTDIDGDARPADAGYDIGADERTAFTCFLPLALKNAP